MARILFFDPGGTTAWVIYNPQTKTLDECGTFYARDMSDQSIQDHLIQILEKLDPEDEIGHEIFLPGRSGVDMTASRVIQFLHNLCGGRHQDVIEQAPSCMITTTPLAKDRFAQKNVHIIDALAHAIYYSWKNKR